MSRKPEDLEEDDTNKPRLKLLKGGKPPKGSNWLSDLQPGTVFFAKRYEDIAKEDWTLEEWQVIFKTPLGNIKLAKASAKDDKEYYTYNPIVFCSTRDIVEILGIFPLIK